VRGSFVASSGSAGGGVVNGEGTRTSSEMNTLGPATLRNVYYHIGYQQGPPKGLGELKVTHLGQLSALHAIIILIDQVWFSSYCAQPSAL
jgi:hypothetical protein